MSRLDQKRNALAKERFNDALADIFARTTKNQKVFYVGSVLGNSAFSGRRISGQVPTVAAAHGLCTASNGDMILIAPDHAETVTAVQSLNKAGVTVKGLKWGDMQRPQITINAAADCFSLDAAGVTLSGIEFVCGTTDAVTSYVNLTAARCVVSDCYSSDCSGAGNVNLVDIITLASGANHCVIKDNIFFNTTTAILRGITIEAAVNHAQIINNTIMGDMTTAGVSCAVLATQMRFINNTIVTIGTNIPAVSFGGNPTGFATGNHVYGTDATIANNAAWGTAMLLGNNFTRGGTGSAVSASNIIPALDT